jgi:hypothetical protein
MKSTPISSFTPEQEVLLWAIRVDHSRDEMIAEILERGVDWTYIRQTAMIHGIIPLLYRRLTEEMATLVPPGEIHLLRELFIENAANNMRMTQELGRVLDLLADAGIEVIPFKGPALAMQAYGDLSMRSFCDLDILIHKRDFLKAFDLFLKSGYSPSLKRNQAEFLSKSGIELAFKYPQGNLDIHWELAPRYLAVDFDIEEIFGNCATIIINKQEIKTLSLEHSLLFLCIHGYHHRWRCLKWTADVIHLVHNNSGPDWERVEKETSLSGSEYVLKQGLRYAKLRGGISYPESSEDQSLDIDLENKSGNYIDNNLFLRKNKLDKFVTEMNYLLRNGKENPHLAFYYLKYFIMIPKIRDLQVITLPASLYPLYYFIRPFRVIKDFLA